jgi:hypothetical protein
VIVVVREARERVAKVAKAVKEAMLMMMRLVKEMTILVKVTAVVRGAAKWAMMTSVERGAKAVAKRAMTTTLSGYDDELQVVERGQRGAMMLAVRGTMMVMTA